MGEADSLGKLFWATVLWNYHGELQQWQRKEHNSRRDLPTWEAKDNRRTEMISLRNDMTNSVRKLERAKRNDFLVMGFAGPTSPPNHSDLPETKASAKVWGLASSLW